MTGRIWRHSTVDWPLLLAGLLGPASAYMLAARLGGLGRDSNTTSWPKYMTGDSDNADVGAEARQEGGNEHITGVTKGHEESDSDE